MYVRKYAEGIGMSWQVLFIFVSTVDRVTLIFTHMDLEPNGPSDCHDYVTVRQGNTETAPEVGTYCGSSIPAQITSTGPALFVTFFSDSSVTLSGFRATYSTSESG